MSSSHTETTTATLVDITMPQMGVSVAEGTIVAWRVEVGDRVEADQTLCDISTDKIETEVPSPTAGIIAEILVEVEQTVEVGVVLARLAVGDGAVVPASAPAPVVDSAPAANAPPAATGAPADAPAPTAPPSTAVARGNGNGRRYSPVVQRIAAEHNVDLSTVTGTGRGGRVRKQDVLALVGGGALVDPPLHIESPYRPDPPAPAAAPVPAAASAPAAAAPPVPVSGDGLSRMRRQIGEHMKRSLEVAATCTTWAEADMTRVEKARGTLGVTALAYVARATVEALREYPALNAWLDGEQYTRHADVNLGIAVSLGDDGLIVPVIHRAQELSVEGLAARIRELAGKARNRQLTNDDVSGGTFTITAPGQFGSIMATPVINQPQVGILDFEAVVKRPVVISDEDGSDSIAIRSMTILGLSWDHRALDGALSAQFLSAIRARLESVGS
ncbi:MAG TPA: dihydrolipoamide acetyltransferase family protein [Solirubrobacteraceae bacterium]|nr:dihydrolipoamide acetyltransferase family protein [Solirubrobacteraceae bacterium]